ncbi:hypothetical protein [Kitasatospora sp. NPDC005856]|uniref:hypothetical protein n=1 Tax=Kitasatospora sp. NPDC005856 TaxID=3154566 RepID=UPI00340744AD
MTDRHEQRIYLNDVLARAEQRTAASLAAPANQPADVLAAAAQRLINGAPEIANSNIAWALAKWLEREVRGITASEVAAAQVWPDDPSARAAWIARQQPEHALAVARAVLGQDGDQK